MSDFLEAAIRDYYTHEPTGGRYHIVLDDWNTEDHFIEWCMEEPIDQYPCGMDFSWCSFQADMIGAMLLEVHESFREELIRKALEGSQ